MDLWKGEYLWIIQAMIMKLGVNSLEEVMIVIHWDPVQAIACTGQQASMIMYGIGLTVTMAIGTTQHWVFGKSEVIILQVSLVKVQTM